MSEWDFPFESDALQEAGKHDLVGRKETSLVVLEVVKATDTFTVSSFNRRG